LIHEVQLILDATSITNAGFITVQKRILLFEINLQSIEAPTIRNIHCNKIGNMKDIQSTHLVLKLCVNIRKSLLFFFYCR